jgi:flagellin-like protein
MLRSRKGISPILATLLLIVIAVAAVIVTYAWVMTFTTTQTQQAGAVLVQENIRYHRTGGNFTEIVIRNTGTADAKLVTLYWSKTSFSDLATVTSGEWSVSPTSKLVAANSFATVIVTWGGTIVTDNPGGGWQSGTTYYWKVVTEAGQYLQFSARAP